MATQLLTEEQVKQAAYKYCELVGLDPDRPVSTSSPVYTVLVTEPLWRSVAARIEDADRIQYAMQFAREITELMLKAQVKAEMNESGD